MKKAAVDRRVIADDADVGPLQTAGAEEDV
jgi:hypothetical protein